MSVESGYAQTPLSESSSEANLGAIRYVEQTLSALFVASLYNAMHKLCDECGEAIDDKRLLAVPNARLCIECANIATQATVAVLPPKPIASKPTATAFHLKRYLKNVGKKSDEQSLFRTLVRVTALFPHVSAVEMTSIFVQWSKQTNSDFDHERIRKLVGDARQRVMKHADRGSTRNSPK